MIGKPAVLESEPHCVVRLASDGIPARPRFNSASHGKVFASDAGVGSDFARFAVRGIDDDETEVGIGCMKRDGASYPKGVVIGVGRV